MCRVFIINLNALLSTVDQLLKGAEERAALTDSTSWVFWVHLQTKRVSPEVQAEPRPWCSTAYLVHCAGADSVPPHGPLLLAFCFLLLEALRQQEAFESGKDQVMAHFPPSRQSLMLWVPGGFSPHTEIIAWLLSTEMANILRAEWGLRALDWASGHQGYFYAFQARSAALVQGKGEGLGPEGGSRAVVGEACGALLLSCTNPEGTNPPGAALVCFTALSSPLAGLISLQMTSTKCKYVQMHVFSCFCFCFHTPHSEGSFAFSILSFDSTADKCSSLFPSPQPLQLCTWWS